MLENIIGNEINKGYLRQMVAKKATHHSLLFAGPDGIGKSLFALGLAEEMLGSKNHPDLHIYYPEGKVGMHTIQSMREFSEAVYMAPFQGLWKIFILHDAERMLPTSANALLKTFEEPSPDSIIILLSSQPATILPTILSRCRILHFQPLREEEVAKYCESHFKLGKDEAKRLALLSHGSIGQAECLLNGGNDKVRLLLLNFLAKDKILHYKELTEAIEEISLVLEHSKKQVEEKIQEQLYKGLQDTLTAVQKETLQKEVDGAVSIRLKTDAGRLFEIILGWYRDIQLMLVNGDPKYLVHPDFEEEIEQALHRGHIISLEKVQQTIAESALALERSTSLALVLENLFLKLNKI